MIEWSDTDLMVRDAVRQFVDKEIRPHLDELETGALSPYPMVRKLFSQFGLDVMAAESVKKMLDSERAKLDGGQATQAGDDQDGESEMQAVSAAASRDRWPRYWCPKSPESASDC
jgi:hypothetical protein